MPFLADDILSKTNSEEQMLYLTTLFQEAQPYLGKYSGADELMPALVDYLQTKYQPEKLNPVLLQTIYTHLYAWYAEGSNEDAYIFTCVQGALLHIISESLNEPLNKALELINRECLNYILELQEQLEKNPEHKLTQKRLDIVSKAHQILQNEDYSDIEKAELFSKIIADNQAVFNQDQHPRATLFLKAVAVFMAFCLGAGIGGVFAYHALFNQKNEDNPKEKLFNLSIFKPHPDQSLEQELAKNLESKGSDSDITP